MQATSEESNRKRIKGLVLSETPFQTKVDVFAYSKIVECSENVIQALLNDVQNGFVKGDFSEDYRTIKKIDRLPANHRRPKTPDNFWAVTFDTQSKMMTDEELKYLEGLKL
jgi:hypothetical protein